MVWQSVYNAPSGLVHQNPITLQAGTSGTINLTAPVPGTTIAFGQLTSPGATLTVNGPGNLATFTQTRFTAPGLTTLAGTGPMSLGQTSDTGNAVTLTVTNTGGVILDQRTGTPNSLSNTTLIVNGGLVNVLSTDAVGGFSPIASITQPIQLNNGGTLRLNAEDTDASGITGTQAPPFANSITVNNSGGLQHTSNTADISTGLLTINSGMLSLNNTAGTFEIQGKITGLGGINVTGGAPVTIGPVGGTVANDFAGDTVLNGGTLNLAKAANISAIGGNLVINSGTVNVLASEQMNPAGTTQVTFGIGGTMDLKGNTQTIGGLTMSGGTITGTTGALLKLNPGGQIQYNGAVTGATAATVTTDVDLRNSDPNVQVAAGTVSAPS